MINCFWLWEKKEALYMKNQRHLICRSTNNWKIISFNTSAYEFGYWVPSLRLLHMELWSMTKCGHALWGYRRRTYYSEEISNTHGGISICKSKSWWFLTSSTSTKCSKHLQYHERLNNTEEFIAHTGHHE